MPPEPLFCPECRAEYLWTASRCVECEVELVPALSGPEPVLEMPPVAELVCIRAASLGWVRGLSDRLAEAGISHRVEVAASDAEDGSRRRPGANLPYGVYVRAEDVPAAAQVDMEHARAQIPDLALPDADLGAAGAGDGLAGAEGDGCPACGAAVGPADEECPDCGLVLAPGG